jgi:hypothetical protein
MACAASPSSTAPPSRESQARLGGREMARRRGRDQGEIRGEIRGDQRRYTPGRAVEHGGFIEARGRSDHSQDFRRHPGCARAALGFFPERIGTPSGILARGYRVGVAQSEHVLTALRRAVARAQGVPT